MHFTEEEYEKARKAYYGSKSRNNNNNNYNNQNYSSANAEQEAFNRDFFNPHTFAGQERTKFYNQRENYLNYWRERNQKNSPPWKVKDDDKMHYEYKNNHNKKENTTKTEKNSLFQKMKHLRHTTNEKLAELKNFYKTIPGFGGIDGSRFDAKPNVGRVQHQIHQHPQLAQYILMQQRAKDKVLIDDAVGTPIFLIIASLMGVCCVIILWKIAKSYYYRYLYKKMKQEEEERGEVKPG
ncbi:hypothetical protein AGDE_09144 [Angomonas deanei]|uniref:Uncharacterized protein n=1 Tax=Angomonas deanei TaxID=59799 RepID=A0A7G2CT31_9TRYP|nr:hypothetical protein AGDE_09144 [Angomonas deanei]CAD2222094.1 hypothetical protein, conserved [Angomonas deanei]|eukprot:EPY31257.1 hypothetical protein AGDE_09144 [Angomonas deanei]